MAHEISFLLDGKAVSLESGPISVGRLRSELKIASHRWLSLERPELHRFLRNDDEIDMTPDVSLSTCTPLLYKQSPKHKRQPARGRKGTLCPIGVSGAGLLAQSCVVPEKPKRRWATADGFAYCAMYDNVRSWHGYPVYMTDVPVPVWKCWLTLGKIDMRDLRTNALPTS